jgi:hemolysin III
MGWLCFAAIGEMLRALPPGALTWLLIGGITYTLGAVVYITKIMNFWPGKFGFHEVWHIFVILAALAHFIAIAFFIAPVQGI